MKVKVKGVIDKVLHNESGLELIKSDEGFNKANSRRTSAGTLLINFNRLEDHCIINYLRLKDCSKLIRNSRKGFKKYGNEIFKYIKSDKDKLINYEQFGNSFNRLGKLEESIVKLEEVDKRHAVRLATLMEVENFEDAFNYNSRKFHICIKSSRVDSNEDSNKTFKKGIAKLIHISIEFEEGEALDRKELSRILLTHILDNFPNDVFMIKNLEICIVKKIVDNLDRYKAYNTIKNLILATKTRGA